MGHPKRAGQGKSLYLDTELRVRDAEEMLSRQLTGRQIVTALIEKHKIVERTAYAALKIAYERLAATSADERDIRKMRMRATLQAQYQRCIAEKRYQDANRAADMLCKIDGLYAAEKVEITTTTVSVEMSIQAVVSVLDEPGRKALEIVLAQVEAAKAKGLLAEPEPEAEPIKRGRT